MQLYRSDIFNRWYRQRKTDRKTGRKTDRKTDEGNGGSGNVDQLVAIHLNAISGGTDSRKTDRQN